jgi:hypothetical protein
MSRSKKTADRKSRSVWLRPRHLEMLKAMPETNVGNLTRKAIEEAFEGRHDREYARICIEEDINDAMAEWRRIFGAEASHTITATEEGFRVVLVVVKKFDG